jgi:hypothetical protein
LGSNELWSVNQEVAFQGHIKEILTLAPYLSPTLRNQTVVKSTFLIQHILSLHLHLHVHGVVAMVGLADSSPTMNNRFSNNLGLNNLEASARNRTPPSRMTCITPPYPAILLLYINLVALRP